MHLDETGNLVVEAGSGTLIQKVPRVFQADGKPVDARYVRLSGHDYGLRLGRYDSRKPLTIDPELVYTRTFGGSGSNVASLVTTDAQGNIYVSGTSNSVDFPTTNGLQPALAPPLLAFSWQGSEYNSTQSRHRP